MKKNTHRCVDLKTVMQTDRIPTLGTCHNGILTRTDENHYLFEEAVANDRHVHRNPKLYDGDHISMVRRQDGRYQCHLRTMPDLTQIDRSALAYKIYLELLEALDCVNS